MVRTPSGDTAQALSGVGAGGRAGDVGGGTGVDVGGVTGGSNVAVVGGCSGVVDVVDEPSGIDSGVAAGCSISTVCSGVSLAPEELVSPGDSTFELEQAAMSDEKERATSAAFAERIIGLESFWVRKVNQAATRAAENRPDPTVGCAVCSLDPMPSCPE
jgi:hypothetical protein